MYINVQTLQFVSQHVENYFSFLCRLKFIGYSKPACGLKNVTASLYHKHNNVLECRMQKNTFYLFIYFCSVSV